MSDIKEQLKAIPFFNNLPENYLSLICGFAKQESIDEDAFLAREGDDAQRFFAVLEGKLAINIFHPVNGDITVQTIGKGTIVGWSWLFPPHKWAFNIKALRRCELVSFDGKAVRDLCDGDHELGYLFMKEFSGIMTSRLKATRMQLLDVYGN